MIFTLTDQITDQRITVDTRSDDVRAVIASLYSDPTPEVDDMVTALADAMVRDLQTPDELLVGLALKSEATPPPEDEITAAQQKVRTLTARVDRARADRDEIIRAAIADGMSAYRIAQLTGLTQRAVHMIRDAK